MSCHSHISYDSVMLDVAYNQAHTLRFLKEDYDGAYKAYSYAANKGHAKSQFELARMYQDGLGVEADPQKAFEWYLKSARGGMPYAYRTVADCFFRGDLGTMTDEKQAFYWYKKAGEFALDQLRQNCKVWGEKVYDLFSILSQCYEKGIGTEVSQTESESWKDKIKLIKGRDYSSSKHPDYFDIESYRNLYAPPVKSEEGGCQKDSFTEKISRSVRNVFSWVLFLAIAIIVLWLIHMSVSPGNKRYTGWEDDPPSPYERF